MRETLDDRDKCLSIQRKDKYKMVNYYHVLRQYKWQGMTNILFFDPRMAHVLTSFVVFLTSGNKPLTKDISRKNLNLKESNVGIFWQAFYNKLLPKPFETMCVNYSKLGLLSQGGCFEQCLIKSFHNETNGTRIPPGVRVLKDDAQNIKKRFVNVDELSLKLGKGSSNETWGRVFKKMGTTCEKKCERHDCKSITYNPIALDKFNTSHPTFT